MCPTTATVKSYSGIPEPSNRVRCYLPNGERMRRCCRGGRPARRGPPGTSNNKNLHSQAMSLVFPLSQGEKNILVTFLYLKSQLFGGRLAKSGVSSQPILNGCNISKYFREKLLFVRLVRTCLAIWAHLPLFKWQAGCLAGCHFV